MAFIIIVIIANFESLKFVSKLHKQPFCLLIGYTFDIVMTNVTSQAIFLF